MSLLPRQLKRFQVFLALALAVLFLKDNTFAQQRHLRFERLGMPEGLSDATITSIHQGLHGFLWIGTWSGLNRYDGYEVKTYRPIPGVAGSMPDSAVFDLAQNTENTLWIATGGGGLAALDLFDNTFTQYRSDENDPTSVCSDNLRTLLFDKAGFLWVGSAGGGICKMDMETGKFVHYRSDGEPGFSLISNFVYDLASDDEGYIWGACRGGVSRINPKTGEILNYPIRGLLRNLLKDSKGTLWVGGSEGLMHFDTSRESFLLAKGFPGDRDNKPLGVSGLLEDRMGRFWAGTSNGGLVRYSRDVHTSQIFLNDPSDTESLSHNAIMTLFEDRTGVLWIGTKGGWLNKLHLSGQRFRHYKSKPGLVGSLSHNNVRAILRTQSGFLLVGTEQGLNVLDNSAQHFRHYSQETGNPNSLNSDSIYAITEDVEGQVWLGTSSGLSVISLDESQIKVKKHYEYQKEDKKSLSSNSVRAITFDRRGRLWVGTKGGGLNLLKEDGFYHFRNDPQDKNSLSHDFVYQVFEDMRGFLWLGTIGGGLNRFDPDKQRFSRFYNRPDQQGSISSNRIFSIAEDEEGNLWVGTGNGLDIHVRTRDTFESFYPRKEAIAIYGIQVDKDGLLWLSSSDGLYSFNPVINEFRSYGIRDGLQSRVFSLGASFEGTDGEIYFGGVNGYNAFYPTYFRDDPHPPKVALTRLTVNHEKQISCKFSEGQIYLDNDEDCLTLSHTDEVLSFEFSGLHYANPERNTYAWRMDGVDEDWIYASAAQRRANYTRLPAGDFVFRLKAANRDGIWSDKELSLKVHKNPPPWLGNLAILSYFILIVSAVFALFKVMDGFAQRKQDALEQQNMELEAAVEERTRQLRRAHKELLEVAHQSGMAEIATSVLHNVGNVLNSINVSGQFLEEHVRDSHMADRFHRANELFEEMLVKGIEANDRKAQELLKYFQLMESRLRKDFHTIEEDVGRMQEGIKLIKKIVKSQQSYASIGLQEEEEIPLDRVVRDALGILDASLARHGVEVMFKGEPSVKIAVQRTKLIHVVLNLIKNAKEAMETCDAKKLYIRVEKRNGFGYLSFNDTGIGIEPQKLSSVFNHGYTTKKGGHGFGLHSCANSMTEMGGTVWAESEGMGKGATFSLKFPLDDGHVIEPGLASPEQIKREQIARKAS